VVRELAEYEIPGFGGYGPQERPVFLKYVLPERPLSSAKAIHGRE
jgi:hypothetical protein